MTRLLGGGLFVEAANQHLQSLGHAVDENVGWQASLEDSLDIRLLSRASVRLFLHYVAFLEDLPDASGNNSRFSHLPWTCRGLWLPLRCAATTIVDCYGESVVLGGCPGLLDNLDAVRKMSTFNLGKEPAGYREMLADPEAFDPRTVHGDLNIVQWIWKALYDGADFGITKQAAVRTVEA